MKKAPYFDQQPNDPTGIMKQVILVGVDSWKFYRETTGKKDNKGKLIYRPTTEWSILKQIIETRLGELNEPLILDSDQLSEIANLKLVKELQNFVCIFKCGDLTAEDERNIMLNLAKTNVKHVHFYDQMGEPLHDKADCSNWLETLRPLQEEQEDDFNLADCKSKREKVERFISWMGKTLGRNLETAKTFQYNGIIWEELGDEKLKRLAMNFYNTYNADYSKRWLDELVELTTLNIAEIPLPNPDFLGFRNGVLNKKTGEFLPHFKESYLRHVEDYDCTISLDTPCFNQWLDHCSDNDEERKQVILSALYMILTNRHNWQLFIEVYGVKGSGKSIFGEIATIINGEELTANLDIKGLETNTGRSIIIGKTLLYSPDQGEYKGKAEELKKITGGDRIEAKKLYDNNENYRPKIVFLMTTNEIMNFNDKNGGIARRRVIIPFDKEVKHKDINLLDKVKLEVYGIVHLVLNRFKDNPLEAKEILEAYRDKNKTLDVRIKGSHVLDFAMAFTVTPKNEKGTFNGLQWGSNKNYNEQQISKLYHAYLFYCDCMGIRPLTVGIFKGALEDSFKELGIKEKVQTRIKDGNTITNINWINKSTTLNEWRG